MYDKVAAFAMGAILNGSVTGSSVSLQMLESGDEMPKNQSDLINLIVVKTIDAAIARAINFGITDDNGDSIGSAKGFSNKPSWSKSPPWANYIAMDADGEWMWHQHEPVIGGEKYWNSDGMITHAATGSGLDRELDWTETKEQR